MFTTGLDILVDSLYETLSLFWYLYLTYLFMEYLELKTSKKTLSIVKKSGKFGPIWGGFLGLVPQCGFSVAAANLFATKLITLGTLIAIFLSTSDEMLPVLLSSGLELNFIIGIMLLKVFFAIIAGFVVDTLLPKSFSSSSKHYEIADFCEREKCKCAKSDSNIWKAAFNHTEKISIFIFVFAVIMHTIFAFGGEETLHNLINDMPIFSKVVASGIGLIPSCYPSVMFAQLYLEHSISLGTMLAGTLSNAGLGFLILYRVNPCERDNLKVLALLFGFGVVFGIITDLLF